MTSRSNPAEIIVAMLIVAAGLGSAAFLNGLAAEKRPPLPAELVDADLQFQGSRLRGFAFGMEGLIADWYWTRSLQYMGDKILSRPDGAVNIDDLRDLNPRLLYPYLNAATDLDPKFAAAYNYGAVVLPAIDPQKAIDLINKGIKNDPTNWRLYQQLGYIYWRLERYEEASSAYETGSRIEGSAPFLRLMAAALKVEGGSRVTARAIYSEMFSRSDDPAVRETADFRLKQLDFYDEKEVIDKVLADFRQANGRCANTFGEIGAKLLDEELPGGRSFATDRERRLVDPSGAPYILDRERCEVKLDPEKTKVPIDKLK